MGTDLPLGDWLSAVERQRRRSRTPVPTAGDIAAAVALVNGLSARRTLVALGGQQQEAVVAAAGTGAIAQRWLWVTRSPAPHPCCVSGWQRLRCPRFVEVARSRQASALVRSISPATPAGCNAPSANAISASSTCRTINFSTSSLTPALNMASWRTDTSCEVIEAEPALLSASAATPSSRSAATLRSTVGFPERRSSPAGLPVATGSPQTPRTSSRSAKAMPAWKP